MGNLSRKEKDKLRHREHILDAALKLFSEKGFHNVSMQEIAKESEFSVGTLYNFFESKEQLFEELIKTGVEKICLILVPILDSNKDEKTKISEFFQAHVDLIEKNIGLIRLYISQYGKNTVSTPEIQQISSAFKTIVSEKLTNIIREGIKKQHFRQIHPEIVTLSIRSTLEAFSFESSENFDRAKVKEGISEIESFFISSLTKKEEGGND